MQIVEYINAQIFKDIVHYIPITIDRSHKIIQDWWYCGAVF